jgi:hypothetical protein
VTSDGTGAPYLTPPAEVPSIGAPCTSSKQGVSRFGPQFRSHVDRLPAAAGRATSSPATGKVLRQNQTPARS